VRKLDLSGTEEFERRIKKESYLIFLLITGRRHAIAISPSGDY
jgi:hypothetical protein